MATGMMVVCFGRATKLLPFMLAADKVYSAEIQLGTVTDTGDALGCVIEQRAVSVFSEQELQVLCQTFSGPMSQIPPMHSALKHKGQPLYRLARAGKIIARPSREVMIFSNDFQEYDAESQKLSITVHCSKGTYIRTLAEDMGKRLGCGAHLSGLHRLWTSPFEHHPMVSWYDLISASNEKQHDKLAEWIMAPEVMVGSMPVRYVSKEWLLRLRHGQSLDLSDWKDSSWVRLYNEDKQLYAIACHQENQARLAVKWLQEPLDELHLSKKY